MFAVRVIVAKDQTKIWKSLRLTDLSFWNYSTTHRMDSGRMPGGDPFDPEASEERVRFAQQMADPLAAQMEGSKGRKEAHGPQIKLCSLCGPAKNEG